MRVSHRVHKRRRGVAIKAPKIPVIGRHTFLCVESCAVAVGLSVRHFRRVLEDGDVPVHEISGKQFIMAVDLREWAIERRRRLREETNGC